MNNTKYKILLDLVSDGIHVVNKDGYVVEYSKSFAKMLGFSNSDMKNLNVKDFDIKFQKDEILDIIESFIASPTHIDEIFETKHIKKDGTIIDVRINAKTLVIDGEKFIYASSRDITNEKLNEEKLNKQKKELELEKSKLETIIHNIPDLLWIKDKDGRFITCNKRFEDLYGEKREEIVGKTDYDFVDKKLADFFKENDNLAMHSNRPLSNFEELEFASDGHKEFLNTTKVKILDKEKNIFGVLGIGKDLTKIKKYQEELEKERTKYKIFMESSSEAIFIVNLEGYVIEYSKLFKNSLAYSDEEVLKLHVSNFEAIHSKEQIDENIKNVSFTPLYFDTKYRRKDNSLIDVTVSIVRVLIEDNEFIYCSFRDISEKQKLQDKLLKQKEEFETIFNYSHDSIAIVDLDTKFLKYNKAFVEMLEYEEDDLIDKYCSDLSVPEDANKIKKLINDAITHGHSSNIEKFCLTKSAKKITVNISASLLPDKKTILLNIKDISNLKIMEEQTKLASMGEMIGNIAHQWRQPLSVITTNMSGLKLKSDLFGVKKEDIDICEESVLKQAKYLSSTIDNFRNFIKGEKSNKEISIRSVLENALSLVHFSLHNNFINEIIDLKDDLEIFANKNELAEAFINIFNNTKDVLKTNIKNESDRLLFVSTKLISKESIEIDILDSGLGISEDIINKIFEPYFTTKHQSQGTGLGLSMADKIIRERHGGLLEVSNKEFEYKGKKYYGALFKITFSVNGNLTDN